MIQKQIYDLCYKQTPKTWRLANAIESFLRQEPVKVYVEVDGGFQIGNSIRMVIHQLSIDKVIANIKSSSGMEAIQMDTNTIWLPKLLNTHPVHILVVFIVTDKTPDEYANDNRCNLLRFNADMIMSVVYSSEMKQRTDAIELGVMQHLFHPKRIAKWITSGNDLEDYML